ncbi:MAG TPA: aminotransferase class V-fold PLP-dependent enzyme [Gemmatimonadales bacterium]
MTSTTPSATDWRGRIPLLASHIPMNHCSQAPLTDLTRAAAERYLESWNRTGMDWDAWMEEVRRAKQDFARLVNASPDEIAVFSSVSEATSAVASALEFTHRPKVVVSEAEFPGVGQVWLAQQRRGARVVWVPLRGGTIDPADYDGAIDGDTAIVSACHGYYLNGSVQELKGLAARAHARGALLYADAYQTLGALPVDVKALDVDFLAGGCLKFLMGTAGIAFLYARRELVESLYPSVTGWFGRTDPFAFRVNQLDWPPNAARFDTGTPPVMNAYIARAGMQIVAEVGLERIRACHLLLARRLIEGGRARGLTLHGRSEVEAKTVSTAFVVSDSHTVEAALRARGVLASARGPVIRLAPHFYNTIEDVDTALDALAAVVAGR